MENPGRNILDTKVLIGLFVILAGILIFLDNLGYELVDNIWDWWPIILILIGAGQIMQPKEARQSFTGGVMVLIGGIILLNNLDLIDVRFRDLWPLILILVGIMILRHTVWDRGPKTMDLDFINLTFVLGGGDQHINTQNLKGGKITAIMGGGTIDLTRADFTQDVLVLDTFALWGGIEIRVPDNWHVNIQGLPLLGGMENKTYSAPPKQVDGLEVPKTGKTVVIKGMAIMGGVEVKN